MKGIIGNLMNSTHLMLAVSVLAAAALLPVSVAQADVFEWTYTGPEGDPDILDPADFTDDQTLHVMGDNTDIEHTPFGQLGGDATVEALWSEAIGGGGPTRAHFLLDGYTLTLNSGGFDNIGGSTVRGGTLEAPSGVQLEYLGGSVVDSRWEVDFVGDSGMLIDGDRLSVNANNAHGVSGPMTVESQLTIRTSGWLNPDSVLNLNGQLQSQGTETIAGLTGSDGTYQPLGGERTLNINVADGETYNYQGLIYDAGNDDWGIEVVKQGAGTQILTGDIDGPNSGLIVEEGKVGISQDTYDTLSLDAGDATVGSAGTLIINLLGEDSDFLDVGGALDIAGMVEVAHIGTPTTSEYHIASASSIDITDATVTGDGNWELWQDGSDLYLIPEPSALILLGLGGLLMLSRRRL